MKNLIGAVLAVALVVDLALFFGIGFGVGALSTTLVNSGNANTNYQVTQVSVGNYWGDGLSWAVDMSTIASSGVPMTTSLLAGQSSTPLTFGFNEYSQGDCANSQKPVWAPGVGADYGFYAISLGGQAFTGTLDGGIITSNSAGYYPVSVNNSVSPTWCALTAGGGDYYTAGLGVSTTVYAQHTLVLSGIYPVSTLSISLVLFYTNCNGNSGSQSGTACGAPNLAVGTQWGDPNGGHQLTSTATTTVQSGHGTVTVTNPGNLVNNGGTVSIIVASGYAGPTQWTVSLLCPLPRTGSNGGCPGGQNDSRFAAQTVANNCAACTVTWPVPAGTSQASNVSGWNTWEVELYNGLFKEGYAPVTINILPPSSPSTPLSPSLTFSTSGTYYYPQAGDSLTIQVYANASSSSGPITSIMLWVYYLGAGGNPVNEPSCGSFWVTTGCPYGQTLGTAQVVSNGANGLVGTYPISAVTPPAGVTQIGVLAESFAAGQQGSPIVPYLIQITPHGCTTGSPGCATKTGVSIWSTYGPILLSVAFILAGLVIAFWVPLPMLYRIIVVVLPVGLVIVLYVVGAYATWFSPGIA
jgi:hypothetical protein